MRFRRHVLFRRRIDRFTGRVSSRRSGRASDGGPSDCADGTTQGRADNCACGGATSDSYSRTNRMSTRLSRRIDRFTGRVPGRSSGHASNGSPNGRTDWTTQSRTKNRAASRAAGGSYSGTNRMGTRLPCQFNVFFHHDEPPSVQLAACTAGLTLSNSCFRSTRDVLTIRRARDRPVGRAEPSAPAGFYRCGRAARADAGRCRRLPGGFFATITSSVTGL